MTDDERAALERMIANPPTEEQLDAIRDKTMTRIEEIAAWAGSELLPAYMQTLVVTGRAREVPDAMNKAAELMSALDLASSVVGVVSGKSALNMINEIRERENGDGA